MSTDKHNLLVVRPILWGRCNVSGSASDRDCCLSFYTTNNTLPMHNRILLRMHSVSLDDYENIAKVRNCPEKKELNFYLFDFLSFCLFIFLSFCLFLWVPPRKDTLLQWSAGPRLRLSWAAQPNSKCILIQNFLLLFFPRYPCFVANPPQVDCVQLGSPLTSQGWNPLGQNCSNNFQSYPPGSHHIILSKTFLSEKTTSEM